MTDPFDALHEPVRPLAPRPAFAAELRDRLARALAPDRTANDPAPDREVPAMMTTEPARTTSAAVAASPALIPRLCVADARAAIRFYEAAFGARVDGPVYVQDDGRVGHAEVRVGDAVLMLADPWGVPGLADPTSVGATTVQLRLTVDDVDAVFSRALAAGATAVRPPADQPFGERAGVVDDPFGHRWILSRAVATLSREELAAAVGEHGLSLVDADELDLGRRRGSG